MNIFNFILLQAATQGSGLWGNLILFGGIAIVFYFFMIRPQQKKQKETKNFLDSLKKNDMVVTIGGIHGKIYSIEDDGIILEVDKSTKIKFEKSAISADNSKKLVAATEAK